MECNMPVEVLPIGIPQMALKIEEQILTNVTQRNVLQEQMCHNVIYKYLKVMSIFIN